MWVNDRFVGTRDPSRGGLQITAATEGFPENIRTEIYDNCLELVSDRQGKGCLAVYPLKEGLYSVEMSCRVQESRKESRPHEIVRGVIASSEEMEEFLKYCLAEDKAKQLFFPEPPDPDRPEKWKISCPWEKLSGERFERFFREMDYRDVLGLYGAVKRMKQKRYRVFLQVPEGEEQVVMAACCMMAMQAGVGVFAVTGGECTLAMPDLLVGGELRYLDPSGYRCMTLEQFIGTGHHNGTDAEEDEKETWVDEAEEMTEFCSQYLITGLIPDDLLYRKADLLRAKDRGLFFRFRTGLRHELLRYRITQRCVERYLKLLYLAFKMEIEPTFSSELCAAPYDFAGMCQHLRKKAQSDRELYRLTQAMLELQFLECSEQFSDKTLRKAAVRIIKNL